MHIQVNSNHSIDLDEATIRTITEAVRPALQRFSSDISGVDIYVNDENAEKGGAADKRCLMEARVPGFDRVAVSDASSDLLLACRRTSQKLGRAIGHRLDKARSHKVSAGDRQVHTRFRPRPAADE